LLPDRRPATPRAEPATAFLRPRPGGQDTGPTKANGPHLPYLPTAPCRKVRDTRRRRGRPRGCPPKGGRCMMPPDTPILRGKLHRGRCRPSDPNPRSRATPFRPEGSLPPTCRLRGRDRDPLDTPIRPADLLPHTSRLHRRPRGAEEKEVTHPPPAAPSRPPPPPPGSPPP